MPKSQAISQAIEAPKREGRPTLRSPELATIICDRLADGESLNEILGSEGMPSSYSFVTRWLCEEPEFRKKYARAREFQAEKRADEIIKLADSATPETANAVRVQVDARKWIASKLLPKVYGDNKTGDTHIHGDVHNTVIQVTESERREIQEQRQRLLGQ